MKLFACWEEGNLVVCDRLGGLRDRYGQVVAWKRNGLHPRDGHHLKYLDEVKSGSEDHRVEATLHLVFHCTRVRPDLDDVEFVFRN